MRENERRVLISAAYWLANVNVMSIRSTMDERCAKLTQACRKRLDPFAIQKLADKGRLAGGVASRSLPFP